MILLAALSLTPAACGADEADDGRTVITTPPPGGVMPAEVADGLWLIDRAQSGGERLPAAVRGNFFVEIDTSISAVSVRSGCGLVVGSLTFLPTEPNEVSGVASFSLPGRSSTGSCSEADVESEDFVVQIMEGITTWSFDRDLQTESDAAGTAVNRLDFSNDDDGDVDVELTLRRG